MKVFVTGIGGLIGSTVAEEAHKRGHTVWGIDSDHRGRWFGHAGSVEWRIKELLNQGIRVVRDDFRSKLGLVDGADLIVHCASQPSHDYSRSHVIADSSVNYMGTVELLEAVRKQAPNAVFVFLSTNKVYGDRINTLPFGVDGDRFVPADWHYAFGIGEDYPIDQSLHTPFGVSKLAADLMVQEYRRTFGLKTATFRCGCLTGKAGSAVEMQGFLGYLVKCAVEGREYTIYGHGGRQVRDNIDAADVADAAFRYAADPKAAVYNIGGGPKNSISVLEAIDYLKTEHGCSFPVAHGPERLGDHKFWVTNTRKFEKDYFGWTRKPVRVVIDELVQSERGSRELAPRDAALSASALQA